MKKLNCRIQLPVVVSLFIALSLSSCLTSAKIDNYVAEQYNNQVPAVKKQSAIDVTSNVASATSGKISATTYKKLKMLPLLFYWQLKDEFRTQLDPQIPVNNFLNALNGSAGNALRQKINGQKLELTIEQLPSEFALTFKEQAIWVVYMFSWMQVWIEPGKADLEVSYTFYPAEGGTKTGKITVPNPNKDHQNLRYFQSWKSGISEYLEEYNAAANTITKQFVSKLLKEI